MLILLSEEPDANTVGAWGDHCRLITSLVWDSKICRRLLRFRMSQSPAVYVEIVQTRLSSVGDEMPHFVRTASQEKMFASGAERHCHEFLLMSVDQF
jgi:hypothetical protein